jgi:hypothetical protein
MTGNNLQEHSVGVEKNAQEQKQRSGNNNKNIEVGLEQESRVLARKEI